MKCPKCGYLGFEEVDRCRNCGYDFSFTSSAPTPDLSIRTTAQTVSPLDDLSLIDAATAPDPAVRLNDIGPDLERLIGVPDDDPAEPRRRRSTARPVSVPTPELPLFGAGGSDIDDEPLITRASPPRAPLAVRRATPEIPRLRTEARPQSFDLGLEVDETFSGDNARSFSPAERAHAEGWPDPLPERAENAAVGTRFVAFVIDLVILAAIDAIVVYFTMEICGLNWSDVGVLPKGPLLAFLLVQNGGYLVAFTAGGQTLGKMATGIRVIATDSAESLDLARAVTRTLVWIVLAVPAGLGFLTMLGRDHRGLHDRFAGTRVVRASAG
jgi:uncharacterized RDD family membrane protein YckC